MFRLKYWKQRLASKIFNHLWNDPESKMREMIENNISARSTAAIMGWLDYKRIRHCKFCPVVDEKPLTSVGADFFCDKHQPNVQQAGKA